MTVLYWVLESVGMPYPVYRTAAGRFTASTEDALRFHDLEVAHRYQQSLTPYQQQYWKVAEHMDVPAPDKKDS